MKKKLRNFKKITIFTLIVRKEIMENTRFKVEDVFGDVISKDDFSQKQITKPNKFLAKLE